MWVKPTQVDQGNCLKLPNHFTSVSNYSNYYTAMLKMNQLKVITVDMMYFL